MYTAESDVLLIGDGGNGHSISVADTIAASYVYTVGWIKNIRSK